MAFRCRISKPRNSPADINPSLDPYASTVQSTKSEGHRIHRSTRITRRKTIRVEFNADYAVTPSLTFTSQTGFNQDFLFSTEDYNRFDTSPGIFVYSDPQ